MTKNSNGVTVASLLTKYFEESGLTYDQFATEIGYQTPSMINMLLSGTVKLPINKVILAALALGRDPASLLRVVLDEYIPGTLEVIEECLGTPLLTPQEATLIEAYRVTTRSCDPELVVFDDKKVVALVLA